MKLSIVSIITLCVCINGTITNTTAQEYFRVITVNGEVRHQIDGDTISVVPGAKLEARGVVVLAEKSMMKMISRDRPIKLQSKGSYDLKEIYFSTDKKSMSFTGKFWNYLMGGLKNTDSDKSLTKYGQQSLTGGIRGFNNEKTSSVTLLSPIYGKVAATKLVFDWTTSASGPYVFSLYSESDSLLLSQKTTKPYLELDMTRWDTDGASFSWQVADSESQSAKVAFTISPRSRSILEEKMKRIADYVDGDASEKAWIEASVYAMEGYEYDAGLKLQNILSHDPDNRHVRYLYSLHLARIGQIEKATSLLE